MHSPIPSPTQDAPPITSANCSTGSVSCAACRRRDAGQLDPATLVADVIMKPADTPLLQAARTRGCATHAGRHMLDHQLPAYLRFSGLAGAAALAAAALE